MYRLQYYMNNNNWWPIGSRLQCVCDKFNKGCSKVFKRNPPNTIIIWKLIIQYDYVINLKNENHNIFC